MATSTNIAVMTVQPGDLPLLRHLRSRAFQGASIADLESVMGVTETAVRQRLARLIEQGLVERRESRSSGARGRPGCVFALTRKAESIFASEYASLATLLWNTMREAAEGDDPSRRELAREILVRALSREWQALPADMGLADRVRALGDQIDARGLPIEVVRDGAVWLLRQKVCPYAEIARHDPSFCDIEREAMEKVLGAETRLRSSLVNGKTCCEFETRSTHERA